MKHTSHSTFACFVLLMVACSNEPDASIGDAGATDSAISDAGALDSGAHDSGAMNDSATPLDASHDAGALDATTPVDLGGSLDAAMDLGSILDSSSLDAGSGPDLGGSLDAGIDGSVVSCAYQDAYGDGECLLFLGYMWDGFECQGIGGCTCVGADCDKLYETEEACIEAHAPCSASCGGLHGTTCPSGAFCKYEIEDMCGATDALGTCSPITDGCFDLWDPVCGCDGMTYSNTCYAAREGVSVYAEGECAPVPD